MADKRVNDARLEPLRAALDELRHEVLALTSEGGAKAHAAVTRWLHDGRWLSPSEVTHRAASVGVSPDVLRPVVRSMRRPLLRPTGFVDEGGRPFVIAAGADVVLRRLRTIDLKLGGLVGSGIAVGPHERDQMLKRSLEEEAIRSSEIEGAVTTRARARAILERKAPVRTPEEQMVRNGYLALAYVREHRDELITVERLMELHTIVTSGTMSAEDVGRFRADGEDIHVFDYGRNQPVHVPPPAAGIEDRIAALLDFANRGEDDASGPWLHPALRAIIVHFMIGWEHPFVDGNGRVARALWYWVMARSGYWLAEFLAISDAIMATRAQYYRAYVDSETDNNDLTYFALYHLQAIERAVATLEKRLAQHRDRLTRVQLSFGPLNLNHRQKQLLEHALRHPGADYRIDVHARHHDVAYATARADLRDLGERDLLVPTREGRRHVWLAPPDLTERIGRASGPGRTA